MLLGRNVELAVITEALDKLSHSGSGTALVVSGEAGIGKSTLLAAASEMAAAHGFAQLECTGLQSYSEIGYAGLHELIHPLIAGAADLAPRQRAALLTAFGLDDGPAPDRLLVSLAVLGLLEEAASTRRLLLVIDDVQWLDQSSLDVMAFVARRLTNAPLLMLCAERTVSQRTTSLDGLPRLVLGPIGREDAERLLAAEIRRSRRPEAIDTYLQQRVIEQADGNPLAVIELTAALGERSASVFAGEPLPTTRRVERAFLAQLDTLPDASRALLLLIAASDGSLTEIHTAAALAGWDLAEYLGPLEASGLVVIGNGVIRARHPLIRSTVYGAASLSARSTVHRAMAAAAADPTRAAWHRAEATFGPDEQVAAELEAAASTARARGAGAEATAALRRAAVLSPDTSERVRRLAIAAEVARSSGLTEAAVSILREAQPLPECHDSASSLAITRFVLNLTAAVPGQSVSDLLALGLKCDDGSEEQLKLLWAAAIACRMHGLPEGPRLDIAAALRGLDDLADDPMIDIASALVDDTGRGKRLKARLPTLLAHLGDTHLQTLSLAFACEAICERHSALECWTHVQNRSRLTGIPANECEALRGTAHLLITEGHVQSATIMAENALQMADDMRLPVTAASAAAILARALAWQGQFDRARSTLERARLLLAGDPTLLWNDDVHWAAGMVALCDNRPGEALGHLTRMTLHRTSRRWAIADLAEAASACGQPELARPALADIDAQARAFGFDSMLTHRAYALLSPSVSESEDRFRAALHAGDSLGASLEVARTHLLYGEWLRRRRHIVDARTHLALALTAFDAAGATPFADRAGAELRAAGVAASSTKTRATATDLLTSQEWQIAQLAASGMTNREIADRIYVSHRTVAAHLYKVFPKLGITSRNQLHAALSDHPMITADSHLTDTPTGGGGPG